MTALELVLADLAAESEQLDRWVAGLPEPGWRTVTTAEGWTVAHQIGHLYWTDLTSVAAINKTAAFEQALVDATANRSGFVDVAAAEAAQALPAALLADWRDGRTALTAALASVPAGEKVPWFGPPMSPISMATARLMETWAHAHDVAEALGIEVPRTDRVKHVCHLGVRTFAFVHQLHGERVPAVEVRVELTAGSGQVWAWGPADAPERVSGDAWDFALLATRRRHRDDVAVEASGEHANHWLDLVQTFAGQPGNDPLPMRER